MKKKTIQFELHIYLYIFLFLVDPLSYCDWLLACFRELNKLLSIFPFMRILSWLETKQCCGDVARIKCCQKTFVLTWTKNMKIKVPRAHIFLTNSLRTGNLLFETLNGALGPSKKPMDQRRALDLLLKHTQDTSLGFTLDSPTLDWIFMIS